MTPRRARHMLRGDASGMRMGREAAPRPAGLSMYVCLPICARVSAHIHIVYRPIRICHVHTRIIRPSRGDSTSTRPSHSAAAQWNVRPPPGTQVGRAHARAQTIGARCFDEN